MTARNCLRPITIVGLMLVSGATGQEAQTFFTPAPDLFERDVSGTRGIATGDINNDGWPDAFGGYYSSPEVMLAISLQGQRVRVGGARFVWDEALPRSTDWGGGSLFADFDNDGDQDLFLGAGKFRSPDVNRLFRNDAGTLVDVTAEAGLVLAAPTDNAVWFDYDRDGWLDLYVGHAWGPAPTTNLLYRNRGDGTFEDVTVAAGLDVALHPESVGSNGGMVAADFDDDGWPDLYVAVFDGRNRLFLNDGEGRFVDTSGGVDDPGEAFGVAVGDTDGNGLLDIYQVAGGLNESRSLMLLNLGAGQFIDVTEASGVPEDESLGGAFGDLDNDGDLDLIRVREPSLFLNDGNAVFVDRTETAGWTPANENLSLVDFDNDGDLDVYRGITYEREHVAVNNVGQNSHWLRVDPVGAASNRDGIGAKLTLVAPGHRQVRWVLGGVGFYQDEKVAHFGLGDADRVDTLRIDWPSGQVDVLTDLSADREVRVIEGTGGAFAVQPCRWEGMPDQVHTGGTSEIVARVYIDPFDPAATTGRVVVDASALGGPSEVPATPLADGWFEVRMAVTPEGEPGIRTIVATAEQRTDLGPGWIEVPVAVTVYPSEPLVLFDEGPEGKMTVVHSPAFPVDTLSTEQAFHGTSSMRIQTLGGTRQLTLNAPRALEIWPYGSLRMRVLTEHVLATDEAALSIRFGSKRVELVQSGTPRLILGEPGWQTVQIPLAELTSARTMSFLQFGLQFDGVLYLDDIALIPKGFEDDEPTAVLETRDEATPRSPGLLPAYPNPFNGQTVIPFALDRAEQAELKIFDLLGQRVATLVSGIRQPGSYRVYWDATDDGGQPLASGTYLVRFVAGDRVETRKILLLR